MNVSIRTVQSADADSVTLLIGELLHEIMHTLASPVFEFDALQTKTRAAKLIERGVYSVLIARDTQHDTDAGLIALCESYALYSKGAFGIIPEFFVRPAFRSQRVGRLLLEAAKQLASARGWTRLEVTTPPLPRSIGHYRSTNAKVSQSPAGASSNTFYKFCATTIRLYFLTG